MKRKLALNITALPRTLFYLGLICAPLKLSAENTSDTPLTEIRVRVGNATDAQEARQMEQLLSHLKGQPANEELTKAADLLKTTPDQLADRVAQLIEERKKSEPSPNIAPT